MASQTVDTSSFQLPSFAKINWQLQVLGKRPDGYHEISTVLQSISLHDKLTFVRRDDDQFQISCTDSSISTDETNLVARAARALNETTQNRSGARVVLEKQIPSRAGLGGGSANAAVALIGLNRLWNCGLSISELRAIAAKIGADVPFFLQGGTAAAEGTGTTVTTLPDTPKRFLIVLSPNASVSTKEAYEALNRASLTTYSSTSILARSFAGSDLAQCDQWPLINDFEDVIFEIEPEIKRAKESLFEAGARGALLAGSGSSVFGIFVDKDARQRGVGSIRLEPGWRVFSCETLSRDEYLASLDLPFVSSS